MRLKKYNYYLIQDAYCKEPVLSQYMGQERGFECCVCCKGNNAHCFNIFNNLDEYDNCTYQTWPYGREHMPKIIKELTREKIEEMTKNESGL